MVVPLSDFPSASPSSPRRQVGVGGFGWQRRACLCRRKPARAHPPRFSRRQSQQIARVGQNYRIRHFVFAPVSCHLRFADGLVGTLQAYHSTPYRHTLSIFGLDASVYRDERHHEEVTTFLLQKRSRSGGYEPHEVLEPRGESDPTRSLRNFHQAMRQQDLPLCYPSVIDGARAVAVTFAAEETSRTVATGIDQISPEFPASLNAGRHGSLTLSSPDKLL